MLILSGKPFTLGRASYLDQDPNSAAGQARIHVRIRPEGLQAPLLAILDTGAPWCVLPSELVELSGHPPIDEEDQRLLTKDGRFTGKLYRVAITLLADEGESIEVESTVFSSPEWNGPVFIGYNGLLERIRFALDPPNRHLYFGLPE